MKKILSLLLVILMLCTYTMMAIASGSEESEPTVSPSDTKTEENETAASNDTTVPADDKPIVHVGEKLDVDGLEINYVSAEDFTSDNQFIQPKEGNKFIKLYFECTNNSKDDKYISSFEFKCYADNNSCENGYYGDDDLSATISSGRAAKGSVYFEVPVNAEKIEVEYETDFWTSKKAIFVVK